MTKPTLKDFLKDPYHAMRLGYYPDFMSCLALKASQVDFETLMYIKDRFIDLFSEKVKDFPIHLLAFMLGSLFFLLTPFLFPVYAIIFWFNTKRKFKKYHEKQKNKPKLIIEDNPHITLQQVMSEEQTNA